MEDRDGRKTIYVGSPASSWQVRIYDKDKSKEVVRLEFALGRGFLSGFGINRPEDVLMLRCLDVWQLVSLRKFSRRHAARAIRQWKSQIAKEMVLDWFEDGRTVASLVELLKSRKVKLSAVFTKTELQRRLETMQRRLIW